MNSKHFSHRFTAFKAIPLAAAWAALIGLGLAQTAAAAEPAQAAVSTPDKQVSRAEVIADLRLWLRAGMEQYSDPAVRDAMEHSYKQALARYEALRHGPAFVEEVARASRELGETATLLSSDQANKQGVRTE